MVAGVAMQSKAENNTHTATCVTPRKNNWCAGDVEQQS
jgi:hypothetical protein